MSSRRSRSLSPNSVVSLCTELSVQNTLSSKPIDSSGTLDEQMVREQASKPKVLTVPNLLAEKGHVDKRSFKTDSTAWSDGDSYRAIKAVIADAFHSRDSDSESTADDSDREVNSPLNNSNDGIGTTTGGDGVVEVAKSDAAADVVVAEAEARRVSLEESMKATALKATSLAQTLKHLAVTGLDIAGMVAAVEDDLLPQTGGVVKTAKKAVNLTKILRPMTIKGVDLCKTAIQAQGQTIDVLLSLREVQLEATTLATTVAEVVDKKAGKTAVNIACASLYAGAFVACTLLSGSAEMVMKLLL